MTRARVAAALSAVAWLPLACADGTPDGGAARAPGAAPAAPRATAGCPPSDAWTECGLVERLESAGLVVVRGDSLRDGATAVPGAAYQLGPSELRVWLYASDAARLADQPGWDRSRPARDSVARGGERFVEQVVNGNLAAFLRTASTVQAERVRLALTAGPGSTRLGR